MNRRGFLGAIGAAITGAVLDPEGLLWIPGQRVISVPSLVRPVGNVLITPEALARIILERFREAQLDRMFLKADYDGLFQAPTTGQTLNVRRPHLMLARHA